MDRISDGDLSWMRGHVAANRISGFNKESVDTWDDILKVIDELRERRERDKADAVANDQECTYCGEYHDKRTVCNDRYVKEFLRAVHDHKQQD